MFNMLSTAPLPLDHFGESKAIELLQKGSVVLALLHNELVRRIESDRRKLETAAPQDIVSIQQRILATRNLLHFVHDPRTST